jgi:hypothetical protein
VPTGFLPLTGGTITGNLSITGTLSAPTITSLIAAGTIAQAGAGSVMFQGAGGGNEAFFTFHRPGAFAGNFGINAGNRLGYGGWSWGAAFYQLWSTQDFTSTPVSNGRLVYAGDYSHPTYSGLAEPYGGAVHTGCGGTDSTQQTFRYRYMQLFTTGWFTVGYA